MSSSNEIINWSASMVSKGYEKGPEFLTYIELSDWDLVNKRPHVRSWVDQCYQVFFTDGQPYIKADNKSTHDQNWPKISINDDIPF